MKEQNNANHGRLVPGFHGILFLLILLALIGSIVKFVRSYQSGWGGLLTPAILLLLSTALLLAAFFARSFALKAQDRAIRAEERLRHFVLTGQLPDAKLTIRQTIALRFAADEEFVSLSKRAVSESLSEKQIKAAIQQWKADHNRV